MSRRAKSKDTRTSPRNVPRAPEQPADDLRRPGRPVGEHPIAAKRPGEATRPEVEPTTEESLPRPPPGPVIISGAQAAALGEARARKRQAGSRGDGNADPADAKEHEGDDGDAEDPSTPDLGEAAGNPGTSSALTLATGVDPADVPPTSDAAAYAEETPVLADQRSVVDPVRVVDAAGLLEAAAVTRTHVQAERPVASPEAIDRDDLRLNPGPEGTDETPDDDLDSNSLADEVDRQRHGGEP